MRLYIWLEVSSSTDLGGEWGDSEYARHGDAYNNVGGAMLHMSGDANGLHINHHVVPMEVQLVGLHV